MWHPAFLPRHTAALALAAMLLCVSASAKQKATFPEEIVSAKTVTVMARQGTSGTARIRPNAQRAKAQVEAAVRKWGRYQIVDNPAKADLVIVVVEGNAPAEQIDADHPALYKMTAMQLLSDTLTIYKGGGITPDSKPLWSWTETGEDRGWPADRAVEKFRGDMRRAALNSAMQNNR